VALCIGVVAMTRFVAFHTVELKTTALDPVLPGDDVGRDAVDADGAKDEGT
jgi:hypothetical protein